jgi:3-oxoacyl-[acyl-carrier protein] reductase
MTPRLKNKIAVVTGASRGIGQAIALGLAHEGAEIVINYQHDARAAEDIVNTINQTGGRARAIQADSSDLDQMRRFFEEVGSTSPQIDILVNNVGTASAKPEPLGAVDPAEYDRIFNLNTRGLFFTSQEALKLMRDGGRIVNISSLASRLTAPGRSVYAGTKGAVEAFTRVWAAELGGRGITVNSVSPGTVETERMKNNLSPEARAAFVKTTPLARVGQPDDIADVVVFLCSDQGRWLTAQNLIASGGLG